jgi:hypothetical protein
MGSDCKEIEESGCRLCRLLNCPMDLSFAVVVVFIVLRSPKDPTASSFRVSLATMRGQDVPAPLIDSTVLT